MSCVMCHVSCVMCQVSHITCHMSPVTCHMSLTPTAAATDTPPANYPSMYSKDPKISFFCAAILAHFRAKIANSETNVFSLLFPKKSFCDQLI